MSTARDYEMKFGPNGEISKAYKPGKAKLLARRSTQAAANNSTIPFPFIQVVRFYMWVPSADLIQRR